MDSVSCLELALEGERLCKIGDFNGGVAFFEAAVKCGTDDMKTMSAIYSQLGNAYFYLGNYGKAMEYHKLDLEGAKSINDKMGEAKASGNLGNTLKMMGQFEQAVQYCKRNLEISKELNDKVGEGRALYNLGNVFHTRAKHLGHAGSHDPGNFPNDVQHCLQMAITYYKQNLDLMVKLGDRSAQGRTLGNLGNSHYLLGNFSMAVEYHEERLKIAIEFNDKPAERRAQCNLGNAHIFLGEFEKAVENYKRTLILAEDLHDQTIEAQACYSLGNTYTLLKEYELAIEYFLRHLEIAQKLNDRIGEGRSYWSLGNAAQALGRHKQAMEFIQKHLEISKEIGDLTGQENAQISISALRIKLNQESEVNEQIKNIMHPPKRTSMNKMELLSFTQMMYNEDPPSDFNSKSKSFKLQTAANRSKNRARAASVEGVISKKNEEFLEQISKFQSKRMDDQRCPIEVVLSNKENALPTQSSCTSSSSNSSINKTSKMMNQNASKKPAIDEDFFDLIAGMQERRMDDQRADPPILPPQRNSNGLPLKNDSRANATSNNANINRNCLPSSQSQSTKVLAQRQYSLNTYKPSKLTSNNHHTSSKASKTPDDDFFDMVMRVQSDRLEDQRSEMPTSVSGESLSTMLRRPISVSSTASNSPVFAPTVPDEDFFNLVVRCQSTRIEDQRSSLE